MKKVMKLLCLASLCGVSLVGKDLGIDMPSQTPLNVFEMKKEQIGVGYIQFSVGLELEDDWFGDKIGDINYDSKGVIVTLPASEDTLIGKMFEHSFTAGAIEASIKNKNFTDGGVNYANTYEKSGFYLGYRPVFGVDIYKNDVFVVKNATALHAMFYSLSGDFSVDHGADGVDYAYDETSYGLGLKPSTVVSATYFPIHNLGLSLYGGLSTFIALDYNNYTGKIFGEEDSELALYLSSIDPIAGFDFIFKGIASKDDTLNLSTLFASKSSGSSNEVVLRYIFNF